MRDRQIRGGLHADDTLERRQSDGSDLLGLYDLLGLCDLLGCFLRLGQVDHVDISVTENVILVVIIFELLHGLGL